MTLGIRRYGLLYLFLLGLLIADFVSCNSTDGSRRNRRKRSLICIFGLTGILKQTVYSSLQDVQKYDPLDLGDTEDGDLQDGVLKGLSTLRNLSNLEVFCSDKDTIVFSTTLGMDDAEIHYRWTRTVLITLDGTLWMKARKVNFELEVQMNTTSGIIFKVTNSLMTRLEDFEFGFTGLGILNPVVRGMVNMLYKIWRGRVTRMIESIIKKALEKKLQDIADTIDFLMLL